MSKAKKDTKNMPKKSTFSQVKFKLPNEMIEKVDQIRKSFSPDITQKEYFYHIVKQYLEDHTA